MLQVSSDFCYGNRRARAVCGVQGARSRGPNEAQGTASVTAFHLDCAAGSTELLARSTYITICACYNIQRIM